MTFLAVQQDAARGRQFLLFVRRPRGWEAWCAAPSRGPALATAEACLADPSLVPAAVAADDLPSFLLHRWPSADLCLCLHTPGPPLDWSLSGAVARRLTGSAHEVARDRFALGLTPGGGRAPTWLVPPARPDGAVIDFAVPAPLLVKGVRNLADRAEGGEAAARALRTLRDFFRRAVAGRTEPATGQVHFHLADADGQPAELRLVLGPSGRLELPALLADGREHPYLPPEEAALRLGLRHSAELAEGAARAEEPGWFWVAPGRPGLPLDRLVQAVRDKVSL